MSEDNKTQVPPLNMGITWPGLVALEVKERVPTLSFKSFGAFTAGAAARAKLVGDTGPSAPENWVGGFGSGGDHILMTLHALSPEAMASYSDRLSALFAEGNALREIWRQQQYSPAHPAWYALWAGL